VFTATLPKLRLEVLTASVEAATLSCRAKLWDAPAAVAERVTACAALTAETVAEKLALVAPAATVTEGGTETAGLLLARLTANPPVAAAALSPTVHTSAPDPVIEALAQEREVSTGTPVPLRAIALDAPLALLASVSSPVTAPAAEGSNCTVTVADWSGFKVRGKAAPDMEKPVPSSVAELMVTAAVPVEVRVTACVTAVLTGTLPNATLAVLRLSAAVAAVATLSSRSKFWEVPPALAVNMTAWADETAATVAEKLAVVAPASTLTDAGTVTAALLLDRLTVVPPLAAAALRVTVQESDAGPATELLVQLKALKADALVAPVPLRLITAVPLVAESLEIVNWPVAAPDAAGLNCTLKL
jgi:hypothetical protein